MNLWMLRKKVHSSWLITWLCLGFIIGIFCASFLRLGGVAIILIAVTLIIVSFWKRYILFVPAIVVAGLLLGLCRGEASHVEFEKLKIHYSHKVSISGNVVDDVDVVSDSKIALRLNNLKLNNVDISGQVYVSTSSDVVKRGDWLLVNGLMRQGFGKYSGVIYDAKILEHKNVENPIRDFRDSFSQHVRSVIPDPQASLGLGYLLGEKKSLPSDFVLSLQLVGLTHIVVASGYNLTILVRLARRALAKISKYLSILSAFLMILGFIAITGLSPSMVRAGLVSVLSLLAWYYGRRFHPIVLLFFVATLTLIYNPDYLISDVGWQLSFMAFAGVMIIAPLMTRYFFEKPNIGFVPQLIIETIAAQIATLPILIVVFGQISNVALIANLLVLPLVPLAMLLVFITGLFSYIFPIVGWFFGLLSTWLLSYMINVIEFFAALDWVVTPISFSWAVGGIAYLIIIILVFYLLKKTRFRLREVNIVE